MCKTLRAALRGQLLRSLRVGGASPSKQAWALAMRPAAARLRIYGSAAAEEGQAFLQALQPQVGLPLGRLLLMRASSGPWRRPHGSQESGGSTLLD